MTNTTFSIYDLALINDYNTLFYPAVFGDDSTDLIFKEIKPGSKISCQIPFAVNNVKQKFWLTFFDKKNNTVVAKISIINAYHKISDKSKKQNEKILNKKTNFYKDDNPFDIEE